MKEAGRKEDVWFYYEVSKYPSNNQLLFCNEKRSWDLEAPTTQEILEDLYDRWHKPLLWIYPNAWRRTVQLDEFWDINDNSPQRDEETITEWVAKYWLRCKENGYL